MPIRAMKESQRRKIDTCYRNEISVAAREKLMFYIRLRSDYL